MTPQEQAYLQGFAEKCAQYGVDPELMFKEANLLKTLSLGLKKYVGNLTGSRAANAAAKLTKAEQAAAPNVSMSYSNKSLRSANPDEVRFTDPSIKGLPGPTASASGQGGSHLVFDNPSPQSLEALQVAKNRVSRLNEARNLTRLSTGVGLGGGYLLHKMMGGGSGGTPQATPTSQYTGPGWNTMSSYQGMPGIYPYL